jgi:hypothetical protein
MTRREPDAIREAVGAGVRASCLYRNEPAVMASICPVPCRSCREDGPAVIVAFLRALPQASVFFHDGGPLTMLRCKGAEEVAAAVERAAKEAGDG